MDSSYDSDSSDKDKDRKQKIKKREILLETEVFLFKVPTRVQQNPNRAKDWDLSNPFGSCKLTVLSAGKSCFIQLHHTDGSLFGQGLIECYPKTVTSGSQATLNTVVDSTRYFTLNIQNSLGEFELLGIGFTSRSDSTVLTDELTNYFIRCNRNRNHKRKATLTPPASLIKPKCCLDDTGNSKFKIRTRWEETDTENEDFDEEGKGSTNESRKRKKQRDRSFNEVEDKDREKRILQFKIQQNEYEIERKIELERRRIESLQRQKEENNGKRQWKYERSGCSSDHSD